MEELTLKYELNESERLDKFLVNNLTDLSRANIQRMIESGNILVNNLASKASFKLKKGDIIDVVIEDAIEYNVEKEDIKLDIVYEDNDIIVINKPTGMVVHPAVGNTKGTLVNALMFHTNDLSGINGVMRPGIVHRLDKDTSGLLVCCKNDLAHRKLSEDFANKKVLKKYYALVHGVIPHNLGKIDAPIGRSKKDRMLMGIEENGKEAVTKFKVLKRYSEFTLVEVTLETGRTHQIRVHMQYIGFPVVGDAQYGPKNVIGDNGQFLHSKILGFNHPRTGNYLEFETDLPKYFSDFLLELDKRDN